jgi:hypothetical protein
MAGTKRKVTVKGSSGKTGKVAGVKDSVSGGLTLCDALDDAFKQSRQQIAAALVEKALAGDVQSIKVGLSLGVLKLKGTKPEEKRLGTSAAKMLADEPQWQEPMSEEGSETAVGGREPEGV